MVLKEEPFNYSLSELHSMPVPPLAEVFDRYRSFAMPETMTEKFDEHRAAMSTLKPGQRIPKVYKSSYKGGQSNGSK